MKKPTISLMVCFLSLSSPAHCENGDIETGRFFLSITVAVKQSCYDYVSTPAFNRFFIENYKSVADAAIETDASRREMRERVAEVSRRIASKGCREFVEVVNEVAISRDLGFSIFVKK